MFLGEITAFNKLVGLLQSMAEDTCRDEDDKGVHLTFFPARSGKFVTSE